MKRIRRVALREHTAHTCRQRTQEEKCYMKKKEKVDKIGGMRNEEEQANKEEKEGRKKMNLSMLISDYLLI